MKIEVNADKFLRDLNTLNKDIVNAWQDTADVFKASTPVLSGNARRNTTYNSSSKTISAEYPYGAVLDEGYSKKAPLGMSDPALTYFERQIERIVR